MKSLFGGSAAAVAATLLAGSALFYAQSTLAETISDKQDRILVRAPLEPLQPATAEKHDKEAASETAATAGQTEQPAAPLEAYTATAYAFRGRTASGRSVGKGVIAADTRVLPMGTRVRLEAGNWSGDYTVADTGGAIRGRKIDVWVPTTGEAFRFGRRKVKLTVLSYGGRRNAKAKATAKR